MKQYKVGLVLTADGKLLKAEVKESADALDNLGKEAKAAEKPVRDTGKALDRAGKEAKGAAADLNRAERATGGLTRRMASLRGAAIGVGFGAVVVGLGRVYAGAVQTGRGFERLENRITFFTKAQAATNRELEFAKTAADDLITSERGLLESRARMLPLEQAGLITRQTSLGITTGLIDASKALGAEQAQLGQVMFGLGQALSSSTVRAEEFNQVVEPLPGLAQAMDRAIADMTDNGERNFRAMINAGEVTNDLFSRVLVRALQEFQGAGEKSADTIDGKFVKLGNTWERFQRSIVDSDLVKNGIDIVISLVDAGTNLIVGNENPTSISDQLAAAQSELENSLAVSSGSSNGAGRRRASRAGRRVELARTAVRQLEAEMLAEADAALEAINVQIAAQEKAREELRVKQQNAALDRLDAAPRSIDQKAEKIRGLIAGIRKDVSEGLTEAEAAQPALDAYQRQLAALLKKATAPAGPDPLGDFRGRIADALRDGALQNGSASLEASVAANGRNALDAYVAELSRSLDVDLSGLLDAGGLEAGTAAVMTFRDEIVAANEALRGSVKMDATGLPADPALRAEIVANARALAMQTGSTETHRLALEATRDAKREDARAAEDARTANERATKSIADGLIGLKSPYDQAIAKAAEWREAAIAGLNPDAEGYGAFKAEAMRVEDGMIAEAREERAEREQAAAKKVADAEERASETRKRAIGGIASALDALASPYDRAVSAADRWREETRASLEKAGLDVEDHATDIEQVYNGRIAAADEARASHTAQLVSGLTASLDALGTPYAKAVADADRWKAQTIAAFEKAGVATEEYAAKVETVFNSRIAAAHEDAAERQSRAIATVTSTLRSADPSYARSADEIEEWAATTRKALTEAGLDAGLYAAQIEAVVGQRLSAAYEDDLNRRTDWAAGIERTMADMAAETDDFATASGDALRDFAQTGEDAFVSLATGSKFAAKDMVDTILADLARLAYQQTIGKTVNSLGAQLLGSIGGALTGGGGLFGGGATSAATIGPGGTGVFHSGGIIGGTPPATRTLSLTPADIARAPRYHTGGTIGSDERVIVGQVGERIFTPRQFDAMNGTIGALAAMASRPVVVEGGGGGRVDIRVAPELAVKESRKSNGDAEIDIYRQVEDRLNAETAAGRGVAPAVQSRFGLGQNFNGRR